MTKLIKQKINTLINTLSSKKETNHSVGSNKDKVVPSQRKTNSDYGYLSRMQNL